MFGFPSPKFSKTPSPREIDAKLGRLLSGHSPRMLQPWNREDSLFSSITWNSPRIGSDSLSTTRSIHATWTCFPLKLRRMVVRSRQIKNVPDPTHFQNSPWCTQNDRTQYDAWNCIHFCSKENAHLWKTCCNFTSIIQNLSPDPQTSVMKNVLPSTRKKHVLKTKIRQWSDRERSLWCKRHQKLIQFRMLWWIRH